MPNILLIEKPHRGNSDVVDRLAGELPDIVAPALSLDNRKLHDGKVTPAEIMVSVIVPRRMVNGSDIEVLIFAHGFPERVENIEDRKKQILDGIATFLSDFDRNITVSVSLSPVSIAYGAI